MPLASEKFRLIPEKTSLFLLVLKTNGKVLYYNNAFECFLSNIELSEESNIKNWIVDEDKSILQDVIQNLKLNKASQTVILRLWVSNGVLNYIKFDFSLAEGLIQATGMDITEESKEQQALCSLSKLTNTGAWFYDVEKKQLYWSTKCFTIHETTSDENITLERAFKFFKEDRRSTIKQHFDELLKLQQEYEYVEKIHTDKGNEKSIRVIAKPVVQNNKVVYVNGAIADVTEQQNYLEQLKKSEETKHLALKGIRSGLFDHNVSDSKIRYSNSFKKMLGLSLKHDYVTEDSFLERIHPDDLEEAIVRHHQNLQKDDKHYYNYYRIKHHNGEYRHYDVYGYKKLDASNNVTRIVGNLIDVQDKKEREQLITEQSGWLRAMINHGFDYAILLDTKGKILMADKNTVEIIKKDFNINPLVAPTLFIDVMPVNFKVPFAHEFNEALKGNVTKKQIERIADDGQMQWLQVSYAPICDQKKVVRSVLITFQNITDLKIAEYKIKEAHFKEQELSNLKSNLLSVFSHEIRTPLNGIITISKLLLDEHSMEERDKLVDYLDESKDRLLETLNNLSNYSEIETIQSTLKLEPTDINFEVESCFRNLKHQAQSKRLSYELHLSNTTPIAIIDKEVLSTALHNIIHNAIKYTEKGTIDIEVIDIAKKDLVHINIKDTGIGIDKKNLKKIFDPFVQESVGLSRKYEGTGIGLSLAKRFIEVLKGTITVKSHINKGTNFQIVIPKHL
ncbi:PAS domain-containing sensor histidine kinase [Aquimarina intermedia]|uniref:histidine kinase n=1 Tax=Aquimarina intermedia TaxID=350814 RepID=A0A5S5BWG7_9FLAO|nr:ATP-binding protein [Aquimarina intermedia]TYP69963.1 PAS domain S-box-containing protein [Aquimarina intermedia]